MSDTTLLGALDVPAFLYLERALGNLEGVRTSDAADPRFAEVASRRILDLLVSASVPPGHLV